MGKGVFCIIPTIGNVLLKVAYSDVLAKRPVSDGTRGFFYATDNNTLYFDTGPGPTFVTAGGSGGSGSSLSGDPTGVGWLALASGGMSTPTGTGFVHITAGVEDGAAKLVDTADINARQVTLAKIQNAIANAVLLGSGAAGAGASYVELTLDPSLSMVGNVLSVTSAPLPLPYAPGSFTIPTGKFVVMSKQLQLTGSQTLTIQGTGQLRIT